MNRTSDIIDTYFGQKGDELLINGVTVSSIVSDFPTPLYIYDLSVLKDNYLSLKNRLTRDAAIFYSVKANPSLGICQRFQQLGAGAEIASAGELAIVKKAGFAPEQIIFAGPGKTVKELRLAAQTGILSVNIESTQELEAINTVSKELNRPVFVSLRINPQKNISGSQLQMGGGATPFGIEEEKIPEVMSRIRQMDRVRFQGLHVYVGNQIFDYELAMKNIRNTLNIARSQSMSCRFINFGGGFGIPYYKNESPFQETEFINAFNPVIQSAKKEALFGKTTFMLELGRYLAARCGIFLTRVLYVKKTRTRTFAVVDGGMNFNSMATGNLGQRIKRKFPVCVANRLGEKVRGRADIVGPLCTPMDNFGRDFDVPAIAPGDIVAVFFMGAYNLSASPFHFLSHPCCSELAVENGTVHLLRKAADTDRILEGQFPIPQDSRPAD